MENPIKMDDLGVPLFSETSISLNLKDKIGWEVSPIAVIHPKFR